jgi:hypothetical protein
MLVNLYIFFLWVVPRIVILETTLEPDYFPEKIQTNNEN